jgi:hypothetical protein
VILVGALSIPALPRYGATATVPAGGSGLVLRRVIRGGIQSTPISIQASRHLPVAGQVVKWCSSSRSWSSVMSGRTTWAAAWGATGGCGPVSAPTRGWLTAGWSVGWCCSPARPQPTAPDSRSRPADHADSPPDDARRPAAQPVPAHRVNAQVKPRDRVLAPHKSEAAVTEGCQSGWSAPLTEVPHRGDAVEASELPAEGSDVLGAAGRPLPSAHVERLTGRRIMASILRGGDLS